MRKCYEFAGYTVIIGDLIDSKKIIDRKNVQIKLKKILSEINEKYSRDIASKFKITLGDEFQGLLKSRDNIIKIIFDIEMEMAPVSLRFGIGIGGISTEINFENSSEIDGSSYHRARAMMEDLKITKKQYLMRQANILISSQDKNTEIDELLNSLLSVCTVLKSKWTSRQTEIVYAYLLCEENQYEAAKKLGITQSSVNKGLNNANFYTYKSAMDNINSFLSEKGDY